MVNKRLMMLLLVVFSISNLYAQQLHVFPKGQSVMVPVRYLLERMGGKVDMNTDYNMLTSKDATRVAVFIFNREDVSIDGERMNLEQAPEIRNGVGYVPLEFIARSLEMKVVMRPEVGEAILQDGNNEIRIPWRITADYSGSPLHFEALSGDMMQVSKLLNDGAKVNELDSDNDTPLAIAAFHLRVKMITMLLERGADANIPVGRWGMHTPLLSLVTAGGIDGYLWNKRPDNFQVDAAIGIMQVLLPARVDKADKDLLGWTALHEAISRGREREAQLLLTAGLSPDVSFDEGVTPLMVAVETGSTEMVILLLANQAKPYLQDSNGKTAMSRATRIGREDIATLLRNYGATR